MSFRRARNRHDLWLEIVSNNSELLRDVPKGALATELAFRDYVTCGKHRGVPLFPSVFELSPGALTELWIFINQKAQFDMDIVRFTDFNEAFRRKGSST